MILHKTIMFIIPIVWCFFWLLLAGCSMQTSTPLGDATVVITQPANKLVP